MRAPYSYQHRVFYHIFPIVLLIFLTYIFIGYYVGIGSSLPLSLISLTIPLALICVGIVFWAVGHTAKAFLGAWARGGGKHYSTPGLWFIALLCLSACGFLSASLFLFEGPRAVGETIDSSLVTLNRLRANSLSAAPSDEYRTLRERVTEREKTLHAEITNPVICGVGDSAKADLHKIQTDLPGIELLRNTDIPLNCSLPKNRLIAAQIADKYDQMIEDAVNSPDLRNKYQVGDREKLLRDLGNPNDGNSLASAVGRLIDVGQRVTAVRTFLSSPDLYGDAIQSLQSAAFVYSSFYERLKALAGPGLDPRLPKYLDISPALDIASVLELPHNLWLRRGYVETWLFAILAICGDLLAAFGAYSALRVIASSHEGIIHRWPYLSGTSVRYLWVNTRAASAGQRPNGAKSPTSGGNYVFE